MIRELERALSGAFAESEDVHEVLRRLRDEGYGLLIVLDRRDGHGQPRDGELVSDAERALAAALGRARLARLAAPEHAPDGPGGRPGDDRESPAFRIDAADLAFLRSIGIDPTRKIRGRRTPRNSAP